MDSDSCEGFDKCEDLRDVTPKLDSNASDLKTLNHQVCENRFREFKQSTYKEIHKMYCALKKIGYLPLCPDVNRRTDLEYIRGCLDQLTSDQAVFYSRAGEVLVGCYVTPLRPTEVQCGQGNLNLFQYFVAKWCYKIDDNQYVVINGCGAAYPVSELFIVRVPRPAAMQSDREVRAQKKRDSCMRWSTPSSDASIPRSAHRPRDMLLRNEMNNMLPIVRSMNE
ncbi:hypothetical protein GCK72_003248 [Caenorhabditis remanei]|uniref:Uncharacterized protein n=1 Tax=Caenorhabditis remanei TaxID=31234 RepID=A0A6A5GN68_CAERE|nr:hypothetical protein GCK72_012239 [Caenorhabditis remanei]XP_053592559.1 hypothetical protein GCK72_003247 [Caenorhabditis remanei]XP_053592560.1 hypothetical protein GCK72_003248 [Caenorhabditis remanei]KAF1755789.1 hypothetical protein GCK72_012239 [Caenorhabditis remanei]KAF1771421.1 hypothetical protein GCK72_003247 [Caenorhabditis remanei]KAF1771422.1 hypothetical protein GCK72_003248 [Caenorhabditis remanei]